MATLRKAKDLRRGDTLIGGQRITRVEKQGPNIIWTTENGQHHEDNRDKRLMVR
jgi:hypothetical protein